MRRRFVGTFWTIHRSASLPLGVSIVAEQRAVVGDPARASEDSEERSGRDERQRERPQPTTVLSPQDLAAPTPGVLSDAGDEQGAEWQESHDEGNRQIPGQHHHDRKDEEADGDRSQPGYGQQRYRGREERQDQPHRIEAEPSRHRVVPVGVGIEEAAAPGVFERLEPCPSKEARVTLPGEELTPERRAERVNAQHQPEQ